MRKFILFKTLLNYSFFSKQNLLLAFIWTCGINLTQAEVVQRWQDHSGQWHYGDQSAAIGKKAQAVVIKNPISVVKNDQTTNATKTNATKNTLNKNSLNKKLLATKKVSTRSRSQAGDANAQHKKQCEMLREKVHHQHTSGKATPLRQNLIQQYERDCIAGNYYAN